MLTVIFLCTIFSPSTGQPFIIIWILFSVYFQGPGTKSDTGGLAGKKEQKLVNLSISTALLDMEGGSQITALSLYDLKSKTNILFPKTFTNTVSDPSANNGFQQHTFCECPLSFTSNYNSIFFFFFWNSTGKFSSYFHGF